MTIVRHAVTDVRHLVTIVRPQESRVTIVRPNVTNMRPRRRAGKSGVTIVRHARRTRKRRAPNGSPAATSS
ncbi:MAG TPA: hypothetical protein VFC82_11955 [Actinomycetaceae bacterium]|nr:hypothetical protein [Actinomycetaceae bacterium]